MGAFFSVIIPLYNKEKDIENTLKSVINQDFKDFEIIIVNDGSTDNSVKVVESFDDDRIKLFHIENSGLSAARNFGARKSGTQYLTFLDADDMWNTNHLSTMYDLISTYPKEGWFGTSYAIQHTETKVYPARQYQNWPEGWSGIINNFFQLNKMQWLIHICSICVEKELFFSLGEFDSSLRCEEDIDFYIRIALAVPLIYCNKTTLVYNMQGTNRISDSNFHDASLNLIKYSEIEKHNIELKQFLDFFRYTQYIKFIIVKNKKMAYRARNAIDFRNLTLSQRIMLKLPAEVLKFGLFLKKQLFNAGIVFSISK